MVTSRTRGVVPSMRRADPTRRGCRGVVTSRTVTSQACPGPSQVRRGPLSGGSSTQKRPCLCSWSRRCQVSAAHTATPAVTADDRVPTSPYTSTVSEVTNVSCS